MYAAVPRMTPCVVCVGLVTVGDTVWSERPAASCVFASPKSSTFTVPSGRTLTFGGFKSR